jgi:hypothetical protein
VKARLEGSVEAARQATALDSGYAPARVALAAALLKSGDVASARTTIDGVKDLGRVQGGYGVLARIKWAQGDTAGAAAAARAELGGQLAEHFEPGGDSARDRALAHEVLGLAYLRQKDPTRAVPHLREAEPFSDHIRALLAHPDPPLRKALERQRRANAPTPSAPQ